MITANRKNTEDRVVNSAEFEAINYCRDRLLQLVWLGLV